MKILIELTYYRPHISGLTIYVERLAHAFVRRGHSVTILTSQYIKSLPKEENLDGIRIVRVPVLMRVSKGVIMPSLGLFANRLVKECDAISLHLPQLDAFGLALRGKLLKRPTLITYHCDLKMPPGILSQTANYAVLLMNHLAAWASDRIITYTQDYADHSSYLSKYKNKIKIIQPPLELPEMNPTLIKNFRSEKNLGYQRPVIGIAARFASEKGIDVLINALPRLIREFPTIQVWFAGPYKNIIGEEKYLLKCMSLLEKNVSKNHWKFIGPLSAYEMSAFYPNIDVLVIPSVNSTESFGLVQIEAMLNGIPIVASDLPGVRQPVLRHKLGRVVPVGDYHALSSAIIDLLHNPIKGFIDTQEIKKLYSPDSVAAAYEGVIQDICQ